ncbi:hypothetical protein SAMN06265784_102587 [Paraburkholderia susongensis]|uniref:Uncharacterized protein n=1 Tax=Paraburkholderia susongensis TaxID=1515439 RepID=A0A1X7JG48_9BURK|nr:hypothetical protein SAMN06265784_102587 [Paraburkholderia susongensis]
MKRICHAETAKHSVTVEAALYERRSRSIGGGPGWLAHQGFLSLAENFTTGYRNSNCFTLAR